MSKNLNLLVQLSAMDKLTAPLKSAAKQAQKLSDVLKTNKDTLKQLEKTQGKMNSFKQMQETVSKTGETIKKQTQNIAKFRNQLDTMKNKRIELKVELQQKKRELDSITRRLGGNWGVKGFALNSEITKLQQKYEKLGGSIDSTRRKLNEEQKVLKASRHEKAKQIMEFRKLRRQLKESGINIKQFADSESTLSEQIANANKLIDQQRNKLDKLNKIKARNDKYRTNVERIKGTSERLHNLGQRSMMTGAAISTPVIGAGKSVVGMAQTAGKFEQFNAILEITEGSSEKAKKSFEWVKQFAVDTPSNLDEAMEAFVKLRAYGLDPTNGLLQTLGDTGAAMGKPVMQAVEAIADALQGENERLKEFGIKGSVVKGTNTIEYSYTDKNGKQQVAKVNKNNRKQIEQALTKIFNEKYSGAMEKQAKTLHGVWSKLEDHWTNFQMLVMQTGAFDWIKGKIQSLLDLLDKMATNSELQKWAEDIGAVIKEVIQGLWAFGEKLIGIVKNVAQFARENKGAIAAIVKWAAVLGSSLTALGGFSMILSFALYPLVRLIYGIGHFTKINQIFTGELIKERTELIKLKKSWFSGKTTLNSIKKAKVGATNAGSAFIANLKRSPAAFGSLFRKMKSLSFWLNGLKTLGRIAFSPLRLALSALGVLFSPIGLGIAAITAAGITLYKNWQTVKTFFGGFWEGLKEGLAPVIEKFKPLEKIFSAIVDGIKSVVKWFTDLFSPIETTQKNLEEAANAGKKFGEWIALGIDIATKPLQWLMDSIQWVVDNIPSLNNTAKQLIPTEHAEQIQRTADMAAYTGFSSGGYVGNGGKYTPMGIVHGGEYVMTKEATSRLGVGLLNSLNYGKNAMLATGLGVSVATAQPIQFDNRPPLNHKPATMTANGNTPMQVTININGSGQSAVDIAQEVRKELQRLEMQRQAKARSSLRDRD